MDKIHVELGLLEYPDRGRLPYGQEGFTLSVKDPTLQFDGMLEKELQALCGSYGIARFELFQLHLFVQCDGEASDADMDEAIGLMVGACSEYIAQREVN